MTKQKKLIRNPGVLSLEDLSAVAYNHSVALRRMQWLRLTRRLFVSRRLLFYVWAALVTAQLAWLAHHSDLVALYHRLVD